MKVEYLENFNEYGDNLIRLYSFDILEANKFKKAITTLLKYGEINLNEYDFVEPMNNLKLKFQVGSQDKGIFQNDQEYSNFVCSLTKNSWEKILMLLQPFFEDKTVYDGSFYQWLYDMSEVKTELLFSPDGSW